MALRWQPFAVAAGVAVPPLVLALLVWPSGAAAGGDDDGGDDEEIQAELAPGDSAEGTVAGTDSADFLVTGDGDGVLRIDVTGPGFDPTLTLVDPESGESLDYNDDTNGLDPQLLVELDDGESVRAEVRSLSGDPGSFVIQVGHDDDDTDANTDGPTDGTAPPAPRVPGPTVVLPAGPATTIAVG